MANRMRALKTWFNKEYEGHVKRGDEFEAASDARARELERRGLADRIEVGKAKAGAVIDGDGSRPTSGPTGETASSSSSAAGQAPETPARRSRSSRKSETPE